MSKKQPKQRMENDLYKTPVGCVRALVTEYPCFSRPFHIDHNHNGYYTRLERNYPPSLVWEPCAGNGDIANPLRRFWPNATVVTNDIDQVHKVDCYGDATQPQTWRSMYEFSGRRDPAWVITNVPFNSGSQIIEQALEHAYVGVASILRLSFLEPCDNRREFLAKHPPTTICVMGNPRPSFAHGSTDSVTTAWFVWLRQPHVEPVPPFLFFSNNGRKWSDEL